MNETYIKLYRKFADWEWYKKNNEKALFLHCLIKANYQDGRFQGYEVPKGSFITSEQHLIDETGMSRQVIRTALKNLEKSQEITRKTTNKFTLISVVNWEQYQGGIDEDNQQIKHQLTNNQPTTNHQLTTIKEIKESKEYKEYKNNIIAPSYNSSNAVEKLPTNKTNEFYYIHTEDIEKYKSYYPAVDIEQEFRNMSAWLDANSKNRKTHNGMARFINSWLSKAQNKTRAFSEKPKEKKGIDFFYE